MSISSLVGSVQTCVAPLRPSACIGAVTMVALAVIVGLSLGGVIPSGIAFFTCLPLVLILTGTFLTHLCTSEIQAPPRRPETTRSTANTHHPNIIGEWNRLNTYLLAMSMENRNFDQTPYLEIKQKLDTSIANGLNTDSFYPQLLDMQIKLLKLITHDTTNLPEEYPTQTRARLETLWAAQNSARFER